MNSFYYIAGGELYRFCEGKKEPLPSLVLNSYIGKVKDATARNEWKYSGTGATFTGTYGQSVSPEVAVGNIRSRILCVGEHNGDIIYSIDIDSTNGLFRKSCDKDVDSEGVVLAHANLGYTDFDILGDRIAVTTMFAGEGNIGIYDIETKKFTTYTEGHTLDTMPSFARWNSDKIFFTSRGLPINDDTAPEVNYGEMVSEMYSTSAIYDEVGPAVVCLLDTKEGTLDEILASDKYDFLHPQSTSDGALYYIKRPYQKTRGGSFGERVLDIVLFPFRLIKAIFGFLNVFSAKYSGKTLSSRGVKRRDAKEIFIEGNLVNAERELKRNRKFKGESLGFIPRSWELHRLMPNGEDTLIRRGVLSYRVYEESGEILISNGSEVFLITKDGKEEKVLKEEKVTYIY